MSCFLPKSLFNKSWLLSTDFFCMDGDQNLEDTIDSILFGHTKITSLNVFAATIICSLDML